MKPNRTRSDERSSGGESEYHVLGGGPLGRNVARHLRANGHEVSLVVRSHEVAGTTGFQGDPTDTRTLREAGLSRASTVVVATQSDRRNLLIAQLVRSHFDVADVVVLANSPDRVDVFADAGLDPVCATSALSDALVDTI